VLVVPNGNSYTDAVPHERTPRKSALTDVFEALKRGARSAHLHLGFGKPVVDLLVYPAASVPTKVLTSLISAQRQHRCGEGGSGSRRTQPTRVTSELTAC
jgi:hypothetical protein